jgi:hypothetical protein
MSVLFGQLEINACKRPATAPVMIVSVASFLNVFGRVKIIRIKEVPASLSAKLSDRGLATAGHTH